MVAVATTTVLLVVIACRTRRDQVGQRLPGAGAGLDGQVLAGLDGLPHRLGHRDLARPFGAADAADGGGEELGDIRHGPAEAGR